MYNTLRRILFFFDPEWVHYFSMNTLKLLCSVGFIRKSIELLFSPKNKSLQSHHFGLAFKNPVGLGAGFDKNARYLRELEALGFGFVEIGTVTPLAQAGNEKPRLFRLPADKALINRMGFNNDGVKVIAERLKKWSENQSAVGNKLIIGGNIGKNKVTPNEDAWKDYEICFKELHHYVDYFVVNVSSPNTPGLRELQEKESLRKILRHLQMINNGKAISKPILLKIAPDLTPEQVDDVVDLAMEIQLDGLVCNNTTTSRIGLETSTEEIEKIGPGGLSGLPVKARSTALVNYIHQRTGGSVPVIASGGIFTGTDAKEKLNAGASLLQVWTGFIYEGPSIVKNICKELI
ncbi:quinone-dependent dihydroorotate dehydrogenase [Terrimonas pollutisoli]|uniref:quinone-dependent dihydroorotate dehydrogenase n=1 Tax=Terrimonas pollutisoli TaxID=3034147 RepID=UPI0023ED0E34|nr:quinone-dependent dihydroorotate dehydrogenase [Terrimonas sp. H1YJ31]